MNNFVSFIIPVHRPNISFFNYFMKSLNHAISCDDEVIFILNGNSETENSEITNIILLNNYKVFYMNEASVSMARNMGIKKATNEYLCFLDCDDAVSLNFSKLVKNDIKHKYDLIMYRDSHQIDKIGSKGSIYHLNKNELIDCVFFSRNSGGVEVRSVWAKIFKKSIILNNNIFFNENQKIGEDTIFLCDYSLHCNSCLINTSIIYYYRQNDYDNRLKYYEDIKQRIDVFVLNYNQLIKKYNLGIEFQNRLSFNIINEYFPFICRFYYFHPNSGYLLNEQKLLIKKLFSEVTYKNALKNVYLRLFTRQKKIMVFFLKIHFYLPLAIVLRRKYHQ